MSAFLPGSVRSSVRSLFIFALAFLATRAEAAPARPVVALLTSVSTPRIWYRPRSWQLPAELEKRFRQAYGKSGYELRVYHGAGPRELAEVLQDPAIRGVFWVSHSGSDASTDGEPAQWDDTILDLHGNDVKEVFQRIHPGIRWLGIVGCNSAAIFETFRSEGFYRDNRLLRIQAFDARIDALPGFAFSLNESVTELGDPVRSQVDQEARWTSIPKVIARPELISEGTGSVCPKVRALPVRIIQDAPAGQPAASLADLVILWEGRFLGVLPAPAPGESRDLTVLLEEEFLRRDRKLKIKAEAVRRVDGLEPFISLRFESGLSPSAWEIFSDSQGRPIGTWSRLYRHPGGFDTGSIGEFARYVCE
ncbi:MAG: hypothetical protein NDJ89_02575 [Oligoflexia bacterium]|nr:hypothetical protein [Oligoflexia bacterium]